MTFSIVARSADGLSWGVAVASKFLAVGSVVPAGVAGIGAIATQAEANVAYKGLALAHMDDGATADVALARLLEEDPGHDHRQLGIVDSDGNAATYSGHQCFEWAGGVAEHGVAIQGNILSGPHVVEAMKAAWDASHEEPDLARRLLGALQAGDEVGGDRRGRQSAALLVLREEAGYGAGDDVAVDLRVDDHPRPCQELERLLDLNDLYLTASTEEEKVARTPELDTELDERARGFGHADFDAWVSSENYEMRVGPDFVDEKVLAILRDVTEQSG
jgi:uncharacterized Ntn-hydrolase superfamily protein